MSVTIDDVLRIIMEQGGSPTEKGALNYSAHTNPHLWQGLPLDQPELIVATLRYQLSVAGTACVGASAADIEELRAQLAVTQEITRVTQENTRKLEVLYAERLNTTQSEIQLGEVFYSSAEIQPHLSGLPSPDLPKLQDGCNALIKQWWEAGSLPASAGSRRSPCSPVPLEISLKDILPENPRESDDMQPLVMEMLHVLSRALGSPQKLIDIHIFNYLKQPTAMIDCSEFATKLVEWTQLLVPWEFKLGRDQVKNLLGQLIGRCTPLFQKQPQRMHVYAVGIMLDAVEVFTITRMGEGGLLKVARTGLQPLSLHSSSPGLQLVASVLQASLEELGFRSPQLPISIQLGAFTIRNFELIQERGAPAGGQPGSYVFRVAVDGLEEPAILKLNDTDHEEAMLKRLDGVPHVVRLVVSGALALNGKTWHAILLQPFGRLLERSDSHVLIAGVACDVAEAILECVRKSIAHRDVTPGNFLDYKGQGYLCDFTAAKDVHDWNELPSPTGNPAAISGTPMYAAVSVLEGGAHTVSSMCEGLFYSLLSICRGGRMPDAWAFNIRGLKDAALVRRGYMMREPPIDVWGVPEDVAAFMRALHALFWPQSQPNTFMYRTDVTVEEVQAACAKLMR